MASELEVTGLGKAVLDFFDDRFVVAGVGIGVADKVKGWTGAVDVLEGGFIGGDEEPQDLQIPKNMNASISATAPTLELEPSFDR